MNPCRCGHLGDAARECARAPKCGEDYRSRLSGPLLDRIDLVVEVRPVTPAEISRAPAGESSNLVAERIGRARLVQRDRYGEGGPATNSEADAGALQVSDDARSFAEHAAERLSLSPRGFTRMLRVARSATDLAGVASVRRQDIAEALAFRHRMPGHKL